MPEVYLVDTSCLVSLDNAGLLYILKDLYHTVITTPDVVKEFMHPVPEWIKVKDVIDRNYQKVLETSIDKGESSIIALALSIPNSILILDDLKARKYARQLGLPITGTLGILYKAKSAGLIKRIKPHLDKLKDAGFRISENVESELLKLSGE